MQSARVDVESIRAIDGSQDSGLSGGQISSHLNLQSCDLCAICNEGIGKVVNSQRVTSGGLSINGQGFGGGGCESNRSSSSELRSEV